MKNKQLNVCLMSAAAISASRPKIHKLPTPPKRAATTVSFARLWLWAVVLLTAGALSLLLRYSPQAASLPEDSAGFLPPIADAQAAIPRAAGIIIIKNQSEAIVGQLAKVPAEDEQITEIRAVSDIDNDTRRELLSIISRH